jgi:hypothetical protein
MKFVYKSSGSPSRVLWVMLLGDDDDAIRKKWNADGYVCILGCSNEAGRSASASASKYQIMDLLRSLPMKDYIDNTEEEDTLDSGRGGYVDHPRLCDLRS